MLPEVTVNACRDADAILSGAVGTHPGVSAKQCPHPESALIGLWRMFDLRISVRTVWVPGVGDVTIVRNITDGAYVEDHHRTESDGTGVATDQIRLLPEKIREVLDLAVDFAEATPGGRHLSVDKPNVFATSRLWRCTAKNVTAVREIAFDTSTSTGAAYELVKFDTLPTVIATKASSVTSSPTSCAPARDRPPCAGRRRSTRTTSPETVRPACSNRRTARHRTAPGRGDPTRPEPGSRSVRCWTGAPTWRRWISAARARRARRRARRRHRTYDLAGPGTTAVDMDEFNDKISLHWRPTWLTPSSGDT